MAEVIGYSDFERQQDGRVLATAHYDDGSEKRCAVRVSVESQITRSGGQVEEAKEVASSDVPEGQVGSVSFGAPAVGS